MAAVGVVIFHVDYHFVPQVHTDFLGVATFFVLSGFLMCYITRDKADGFLINRLVRIVPLYWLCTFARLGILFGLQLFDPAVWAEQWPVVFHSLLFLPSNEPPFVGVGWTLNFEIYFYMLFAGALVISRRLAPPIVAAVIAAVFIADSEVPGNFLLHYYSHDYISYFLGGIALFYLWRSVPEWLPRIPIAILAAGVLVSSYVVQVPAPLSGKWAHALPMLIVGSMLLLARVGVDIKWRPVVLLGDASYALYLTHTLFMGCIRRIAPQVLDLGKSETVWFVALVTLCIASGFAVHLMIEKPMLRFIRAKIAAYSERKISVRASA
jgi:exopolysaccharide production protein ExoZ